MSRAATLALAILLPATSASAMQASGSVTVYRCVDATGHVTLGDVPCPANAREQVRSMQRPLDAPAAPAAPRAAPPAPAPAPSPQVIVVRTPQPMYACVTPDGTRYTSETADGNPRWVPLWTLGYRSGWTRHRVDTQRGTVRNAGSVWSSVGAPSPQRPSADATIRPRPPHGVGHAQGGGTWIRDTCHALPQAEVCARLVDRRDEIRRRFFNAQETERNALRLEERGLNARLAADCGE